MYYIFFMFISMLFKKYICSCIICDFEDCISVIHFKKFHDVISGILFGTIILAT